MNVGVQDVIGDDDIILLLYICPNLTQKNVTFVAIGHVMLKKFWPMVIGGVSRTTGSSII